MHFASAHARSMQWREGERNEQGRGQQDTAGYATVEAMLQHRLQGMVEAGEGQRAGLIPGPDVPLLLLLLPPRRRRRPAAWARTTSTPGATPRRRRACRCVVAAAARHSNGVL